MSLSNPRGGGFCKRIILQKRKQRHRQNQGEKGLEPRSVPPPPSADPLHCTEGPPLALQPGVPPLSPSPAPSLCTCARSCAVSWCELCSCCSISFSTCLCMATCSCRCWFRAWDSLRACLVLDDSTSTVLMTYCGGRERQACGGARVPRPHSGGPETQLALGGDPQGHPTQSRWKKLEELQGAGFPGNPLISVSPPRAWLWPQPGHRTDKKGQDEGRLSDAPHPCLARVGASSLGCRMPTVCLALDGKRGEGGRLSADLE